MEAKDVSRDMALVAEVIGEEAARKLRVKMGGIYVYIPKPGREEILEALKENAMDAKQVAYALGVSQRKVARILGEYRREQFFKRRQLEIDFE